MSMLYIYYVSLVNARASAVKRLLTEMYARKRARTRIAKTHG